MHPRLSRTTTAGFRGYHEPCRPGKQAGLQAVYMPCYPIRSGVCQRMISPIRGPARPGKPWRPASYPRRVRGLILMVMETIDGLIIGAFFVVALVIGVAVARRCFCSGYGTG